MSAVQLQNKIEQLFLLRGREQGDLVEIGLKIDDNRKAAAELTASASLLAGSGHHINSSLLTRMSTSGETNKPDGVLSFLCHYLVALTIDNTGIE